MKTSVIAVVVALVVGVGMGVLVTRNSEEPSCPLEETKAPVPIKPAPSQPAVVAAPPEDKSADEELAKRMQELTEENERLRERARSLEERARLPKPPPPTVNSDPPGLQPAATRPPEMDEAQRKEREERMAAWREERSRMQGRIGDFLQRDIDAATDPEVQQRLIALEEYNAQIHDLRQAMGQAKTNEERLPLRESMMEAMETVRDLTFAQQDYLIRNLSDEYGIKGADQQEAFVESVRQLQENPYFRSSRSMGAGFGPGGPGFGPGGQRRGREPR